MVDGADRATPEFEPLRPASRTRRIAVFVIGPFLWLAAVLVTAAVVKRTSAIEIGLLVTLASLLLALIGLAFLRAGRRREEERYAPGR